MSEWISFNESATIKESEEIQKRQIILMKLIKCDKCLDENKIRKLCINSRHNL